MREENMNKDIPCVLVQDLLPLYVEDLTGEETSEIIKDHISHCSDCATALGVQQAQLQYGKARTENDQRIVRFLKNLVFRRILILALSVTAALALFFCMASWVSRVEMVPNDDIAIAGKYLMPDGRIMLAIQAKGLNQRNVHYLNSLQASASVVYSGAYTGDAEGMDVWSIWYQGDRDSISIILQGSVTLRRNLWYSWFFPADQRGDILYLLFDPQNYDESLFDYQEQYLLKYYGISKENYRLDAMYINGYRAWAGTDEVREVTEEEAALLLAAWEAQEKVEAQEAEIRKNVPDALDQLLDAAGVSPLPAASPASTPPIETQLPPKQ